MLASLLLFGVLGAAWAIVIGLTQPPREEIVQSPKAPVSPGKESGGKSDAPDTASVQSGFALEFDGQSSHVRVPTLSRNDPGPVTIEAWVRAKNPNTPDGKVIAMLSGQFLTQISWDGRTFYLKEAMTGQSRNMPVEFDQWMHLAVVVDEREVRLYGDGICRERLSRETTRLNAPYKFDGFWLGAHPTDDNKIFWHFTGELDEIRVSKTARYLENFKPQSRFEPDANTVALYHCDEGEGSKLLDSSGNDHHGEIVSAKFIRPPTALQRAVPQTPFEWLASPDTVWSEPENLGPNINTNASEDHACVSADGLQLIFVRRENGVSSLWWSVRATPADSWSVAQRMPDGINSTQQEMTPFLSADGLSLWFASNRDGGSGRSDLYVARRETPDGAFGPAIPLGKEINTAQDETSPFVSADGLTLLFGRGAPRLIYQSTRPSVDAPFPQATELANVNAGKWQEFPRLTRDGLHLLFVGSTINVTDQGLVIASREKITDNFTSTQSLGQMFRTGVVSGPSLSGDDSAIYFSAKRAGLTHHDLWVTRRVPKDLSGDNTRMTDAKPVSPAPPVAIAQARLPKLELGEQLLSVKNAAGLKLGDLDGDGDLDLFVATLKAPCVVLRNDGRGHFTDSGQQLGDNASFAVALGDLDGDGDLDAYVCNSGDQKDAIWLNDGHGTFQRSPQSFPPGHSNDVALADIDGDKDLDIVVSNFRGPATIWINDKSCRFTSQQTIERSGNTGVALGDLDRDGDVDLVMTSFGGDNRVWLNDGQGQFTDSQQIELAQSTSVALGDLDRDGHLDLFLSAHDSSQVWFNNGKGQFQASEQRLGNGFCEAVELLDLDADHDLDAVSIGSGFGTATPRTVWRNDGKGRFAKVATLKTGRTQALAVGDLDGDGDPDVVFGNLDEPAEVWLNPSNQSTIP